MKHKLVLPLIVLLLASLACSFSVDLPDIRTVDVGETMVDDINIPVPDGSGDARLEIRFGAGELDIRPGAETGLVEGTATYNITRYGPQWETNGSMVVLKMGEEDINVLPSFSNEMINDWDLRLGDTPTKLTINIGAAQSSMEFGGLQLTNLDINQGAADMDITFSEPNQAVMDRFTFSSGASSATLTNIANANISEEFEFNGGAGNYTLDFGGELQEDLYAVIKAGFGNVRLIFPENASVVIDFEGALTNIDTDGNWIESGNRYTLEGEGPTIRMRVEMGAGNLEISAR